MSWDASPITKSLGSTNCCPGVTLRPERNSYTPNCARAPTLDGHPSIAHRWPEKVLDFFGDRLRFLKAIEAGKEYESVPFDLHELHQPLSKIPELIVDAARRWFDESDAYFMYSGGRLVAIIFPEFSAELSKKLISVVRSGQSKDIQFVIAVLRSYEGQAVLHNVCKEIVEALPPDDPLLDKVDIVLDATGIVTGEFGQVTALMQKKTEMQPWHTDERGKVKAFAERYLRSLDRQIAADQRRSEEWLEKRKRDYGEGPDGEN